MENHKNKELWGENSGRKGFPENKWKMVRVFWEESPLVHQSSEKIKLTFE